MSFPSSSIHGSNNTGTLMDHNLEKIMQDFDARSSRIFLDFMTRIAKFEELVNAGHRFLVGFYQELEIFKRPQINKRSDVVDDKIKSIHTDRMKAYTEAGCMPAHLAIQNINKLHSCKLGLLEHLEQASFLLDELECLKEDAIGIAQQVNRSTSDLFDISFGDGSMQQLSSDEEKKGPVLTDTSISHASIITVVLRMLKLDFLMQENIIKSLDPNTSSSELESYCLMWDLRPYINDNVMSEAWNFVP